VDETLCATLSLCLMVHCSDDVVPSNLLAATPVQGLCEPASSASSESLGRPLGRIAGIEGASVLLGGALWRRAGGFALQPSSLQRDFGGNRDSFGADRAPTGC
jgi:hypothetical protein